MSSISNTNTSTKTIQRCINNISIQKAISITIVILAALFSIILALSLIPISPFVIALLTIFSVAIATTLVCSFIALSNIAKNKRQHKIASIQAKQDAIQINLHAYQNINKVFTSEITNDFGLKIKPSTSQSDPIWMFNKEHSQQIIHPILDLVSHIFNTITFLNTKDTSILPLPDHHLSRIIHKYHPFDLISVLNTPEFMHELQKRQNASLKDKKKGNELIQKEYTACIINTILYAWINAKEPSLEDINVLCNYIGASKKEIIRFFNFGNVMRLLYDTGKLNAQYLSMFSTAILQYGDTHAINKVIASCSFDLLMQKILNFNKSKHFKHTKIARDKIPSVSPFKFDMEESDTFKVTESESIFVLAAQDSSFLYDRSVDNRRIKGKLTNKDAIKETGNRVKIVMDGNDLVFLLTILNMFAHRKYTVAYFLKETIGLDIHNYIQLKMFDAIICRSIRQIQNRDIWLLLIDFLGYDENTFYQLLKNQTLLQYLSNHTDTIHPYFK